MTCDYCRGVGACPRCWGRAAIDELMARLSAAEAARDEATKAKDGAYRERDRVVAMAARMACALHWPAWLGRHIDKPGDPPWDADWRNIVFLTLPSGQVSWHIHDSEVPLVDFLPRRDDPWDGHDTAEKYRRCDAVWPWAAIRALESGSPSPRTTPPEDAPEDRCPSPLYRNARAHVDSLRPAPATPPEAARVEVTDRWGEVVATGELTVTPETPPEATAPAARCDCGDATCDGDHSCMCGKPWCPGYKGHPDPVASPPAAAKGEALVAGYTVRGGEVVHALPAGTKTPGTKALCGVVCDPITDATFAADPFACKACLRRAPPEGGPRDAR